MGDIRVRTAYDLERKYNLSNLSSVYKAVENTSEGLTKINREVGQFVEEIGEEIEGIKDQVDGNITTWFYEGTPTLENAPANEWTTDELKQDHINDLYYEKDSGHCYKFVCEDGVYKWAQKNDDGITEVLSIANSAKDTADSKRRVFVVQPTPPYDAGDIWLKSTTDSEGNIQPGEMYRCRLGRLNGATYNASDWIKATSYTDDTAANNAVALLNAYKTTVETTYETKSDFIAEKNALTLRVNTVETTANNKNKTFTSEPITPYHVGDVYIKETINNGITQNLIYVCQREKLTGYYDPNDFSLQPSYASESALRVEQDKITTLVGQVGDRTGKTTSITQDITSIEAQISDIADITTSESSTLGYVNLYNIAQSEPIHIDIRPILNPIDCLYPSNYTIVGSDLVLKRRFIKFINTSTNEVFTYEIPIDLYVYNDDVYDEFHFDYENRHCWAVKRCKKVNNAIVQIPEETINFTDDDYLSIELTEGNYRVEIPSGYIFARLMCLNAYTAQYATKVELNSSIRATANSITQQVNEKITDVNGQIENVNGRVDLKVGVNDNNQVVSMLNASANEINITGNRFVLDSDNFKVSSEGNIESTSGTIGGWNITEDGLDNGSLKISNNGVANVYTPGDLAVIYNHIHGTMNLTGKILQHYDLNNDGVVDYLDYVILYNMIQNSYD